MMIAINMDKVPKEMASFNGFFENPNIPIEAKANILCFMRL